MINFIKKYKGIAVILVINLLHIANVSPQTIDSLSQISYEELEAKFRAGFPDFRETAFYAHYYLKRAKKEKNSIRMAEGYYLLCLVDWETSISLKYTDSIIEITKGLNDKVFPAKGYFSKGLYYDKKKEL